MTIPSLGIVLGIGFILARMFAGAPGDRAKDGRRLTDQQLRILAMMLALLIIMAAVMYEFYLDAQLNAAAESANRAEGS